MLAPSKATPKGALPTPKAPRLAPSEARSLVTVALSWFATQMLAPSKATPKGALPTPKAPRVAPSEARSLVTLLLPEFATQMLAPSKATPKGALPTAKLAPFWLASYQRSRAICSGLGPAIWLDWMLVSPEPSPTKP